MAVTLSNLSFLCKCLGIAPYFFVFSMFTILPELRKRNLEISTLAKTKNKINVQIEPPPFLSKGSKMCGSLRFGLSYINWSSHFLFNSCMLYAYFFANIINPSTSCATKQEICVLHSNQWHFAVFWLACRHLEYQWYIPCDVVSDFACYR